MVHATLIIGIYNDCFVVSFFINYIYSRGNDMNVVKSTMLVALLATTGLVSAENNFFKFFGALGKGLANNDVHATEQLKRLDFVEKRENVTAGGDVKRLAWFIVYGQWIIRNVDARISDDQFIDLYLIIETLKKHRGAQKEDNVVYPLSAAEKEMALSKARLLLDAYNNQEEYRSNGLEIRLT